MLLQPPHFAEADFVINVTNIEMNNNILWANYRFTKNYIVLKNIILLAFEKSRESLELKKVKIIKYNSIIISKISKIKRNT